MEAQLSAIANIVTRQGCANAKRHLTDALVHARDGVLVVNSLVVATQLGRQHKHVLRTLDSLIVDGTINGSNFGPVDYVDAKGERRRMIELTEHGALVAMPFIGGRRAREGQKRLVDAFMAMRSVLERASQIPQAPAVDLNNPATLQHLLLVHTRNAIALQAKVEEQEPAVLAHARITQAEGSMLISVAAKTLGVQQTRLFSWLQANGWIFRRTPESEWLAHAEKLKQGALEHKTTLVPAAGGVEKVRIQCRVTAKGLARLARVVPGASSPAAAGAADA